MDEDRYINLLGNLIGEAKHLQNNPAQGLIPKEDLAADHVLNLLNPYSQELGGPLKIEKVSFVEGRSNLILTYPGTTNKIVSFVGSHMDVVPANPAGWDRDPFKMVREGDLLYGRGTTDCLGHVALLTEFLLLLCKAKPVLTNTVVVVFIANEENGTFKGIGIDQLDKEGYMDNLKAGPLFWIDAADSQPCIGTAGNAQWQLKVKGKLFHSGLPHKGINSIEMAMDSINYIQQKFYAEFPRVPQEVDYNYATSSTMKPCQISCTPGALNQLPPETTVEGDLRLTPFYDIHRVTKAISGYAAEINADPSVLYPMGHHGKASRYVLPDENKQGILEFKWLGEGENGIACRLDSPGNKALKDATLAILGEAKPYSIGGSLPLVRELQDNGYDVQISGYGFSNRYHADNEAVSLTHMKKALKIVAKVLSILEV